ncbi:hypothetical protein DL93DRAFT_1237077, partial [Clavulina sp. PMI_390]
MFSSFSNFLPSTLLSTSKSGKDQPVEEEEEEASDDDQRVSSDSRAAAPHPDVAAAAIPPPRQESLAGAEQNPSARLAGARPRRPRQEKPLNETYIIVRPPPAKNNHPLNLQIQLVPQRPPREASVAGGRPRSGDYSGVDISTPHATPNVASPAPPSASGQPLQRVASVASNYSDRSTSGFYGGAPGGASASVTSFASAASGASTASSSVARRIVPLYNLSAHNVMTNTVTDAGTDAKVAKFQKRGLDIMRIGTWEPIEVWNASASAGHGHGTRAMHASTPHTASHDMTPSFSMASHGGGSSESSIPSSPSFMQKASTPRTATGHRRNQSGSADPLSTPMNSPGPTPTASPAQMREPPTSGAKKFFGKVFNSSRRRGEDNHGGLVVPELLTPPGSPAFGHRNSVASTSSRISGHLAVGQSHPNHSRESYESSHTATSASHSRGSPTEHPHRQSYNFFPSSLPGTAAYPNSTHAQDEKDIHLQPAILGLHPVLHYSHSTTSSGSSRPTSYVWVLRKWAKEKQLSNGDGAL